GARDEIGNAPTRTVVTSGAWAAGLAAGAAAPEGCEGAAGAAGGGPPPGGRGAAGRARGGRGGGGAHGAHRAGGGRGGAGGGGSTGDSGSRPFLLFCWPGLQATPLGSADRRAYQEASTGAIRCLPSSPRISLSTRCRCAR